MISFAGCREGPVLFANGSSALCPPPFHLPVHHLLPAFPSLAHPRGLFGSCLHPRTGTSASGRLRSSGRRGGNGGGYSDDESDDDTVSSVADQEIRREVASEEAGMKLNYKHRKLEGRLSQLD